MIRSVVARADDIVGIRKVGFTANRRLLRVQTISHDRVAERVAVAGIVSDPLRYRYQPLYHTPALARYAAATPCRNAEHLTSTPWSPCRVTRVSVPMIWTGSRSITGMNAGLGRAMAIAPDGTWLATAGNDGSVRIWDAATGEQRKELHGHTDWVNAVAIAPDGTWLATAGNDGSVRIWDAASGEERMQLSGHRGAVNAVAIAPGGMCLATAGSDRSVRIWDSGARCTLAMIRLREPAFACAWNPLDRSLVVGGDGGLYRFEYRHPTS